MEFINYTFFALGLILTVKIFFHGTGDLGTNRFLAGFILSCTLIFFLSFHYFYCNSFLIIHLSTYGFIQLYFLVGPFAYFYVRSTLRDNSRIKPLDYLHFAPFLLFLGGQVPYFFPLEEKLEISRLLYDRKWDVFISTRLNVFMPYTYAEVLRTLSLVVYGAALWVLLWKHRSLEGLSNIYPDKNALFRKWLGMFTGLYSILVFQRFLIVGLMIYLPKTDALIQLAAIFCLSMSVLYVGMLSSVFIFNELFYGMLITPEGLLERNLIQTARVQEISVRNDEHTRMDGLLSPEYVKEIEEKLTQWVADKKYLSKVNLQELSKDIDIPGYHLTYYFNSVQGINFTQWRNTFRISYAQSLLDEGPTESLKLDGIAERCGFSSRSTFFRVFKELTGITPSEYLNKSRGEIF